MKDTMAYFSVIKAKLETELVHYREKLTPFDSVFDEDALHATQEQLQMINDEIDTLEYQLIMYVLRPKRDDICIDEISEDTEYQCILQKMQTFTQYHHTIGNKLKHLFMTRDIEYVVWKEKYRLNSYHFCKLRDNLITINRIEQTLHKFVTTKPKRNLIRKVYMHSRINALLCVAGQKKENSITTSFQSALRHNLIDNDIYALLMLL